MRRFILLAVLGGLTTLAGQAVVALALHPGRLAPVTALLEGGAVVAVGATLFITGMLGLAEAYEKVAVRLSDLLAVKDLEQAGDLAVRDRESLNAANHQFWQGYLRTTGGLVLFLGGVLGLTAGLSGLSVELFTVGVVAGLVVLATAAATLGVRGLARTRRAHVGVDRSAARLARLPDRAPAVESPAPRRRRPPRYDLFRRQRLAAAARRLDREPHPIHSGGD